MYSLLLRFFYRIKIFNGFLVFREFYMDFKEYLNFSGRKLDGEIRECSIIYSIVKQVHAIEKGLSLPKPKANFGQKKVENIIELLNVNSTYISCDPKWVWVKEMASDALIEWIEYREKLGVFTDSNTREKIYKLKENNGVKKRSGGTKQLKKIDSNQDAISYLDVVLNRHSVRSFKDKPVSVHLIEEAVELARKTPSVCNRNPWRCHAFFSKRARMELLNIQNGNKGFGLDAPCLIVVSVDLGAFFGLSERRQAMHEGGMFGMSLVYALQYLGLNSCCLNLSLSTKKIKRIRHLANIPDEELPTMMVAVGYEKEQSNYPLSERLPVDKILSIH